MDRSIVLFDIVNGFTIRVIKTAHDTAVQKMTYLKEFGGYLVTCSYDLNLKIWQPANIYGDPLVGRLKGHNQPLVSC